MAGKSPVVASAAQRRDLMALSHSRDRGEADRARALLLTLAGWTSPRIGEAFGVREDTCGSGAALSARMGSARCGDRWRRGQLRSRPSARSRWPRRFCRDRSRIAATGPCRGLADEIEKRSGVRISCSRLSVVLRQKIL